MCLRREDLLVATGKSFTIQPAAAPNSGRMATGAVASTDALEVELRRVVDFLGRNPSLLSAID